MPRLLFAVPLLAAMGCKNQGPKIDPFDPEAVAVIPSWIENELNGQEAACDTSPFWNDGSAKVATTFFAGSYFWDDETDFVGNEFWVLYPDNDLAATGFTACTVVWNVSGTRIEASGAADYGVRVSAVVDEGESNCVEGTNGAQIYAGDETFTEDYDVNESSDGTLNIFFGNSGDFLGRGEHDNNGFSWLSDKNCIIL